MLKVAALHMVKDENGDPKVAQEVVYINPTRVLTVGAHREDGDASLIAAHKDLARVLAPHRPAFPGEIDGSHREAGGSNPAWRPYYVVAETPAAASERVREALRDRHHDDLPEQPPVVTGIEVRGNRLHLTRSGTAAALSIGLEQLKPQSSNNPPADSQPPAAKK